MSASPQHVARADQVDWDGSGGFAVFDLDELIRNLVIGRTEATAALTGDDILIHIGIGATHKRIGIDNFFGDISVAVDMKSTLKVDTIDESTTDAGTTIEGVEFEDSHIHLTHTATVDSDHAFELVCDAAGFSDIKCLQIDYITGALSAGEDEAVILVNIDETAASGGDVTALEVLGTEGSATLIGMFTGILVRPIEQLSGVFSDADTILNKAVDVTVALAGGGAGNISIFVADNDTITIGEATKFEEIEVLFDTVTSGGGVAPTYEFSTGVDAWASFGPADGTNGFRNNGVIAWLDSDIPSWAVGTGSKFLIRITRTRNELTTTPIADKIQIAVGTEFSWDEDGDVTCNSLSTDTISERVSAAGVTIDGVKIKDNDIETVVNVDASGTLKVDTVTEFTGNAGVTIESVLMENGGVVAAGTSFPATPTDGMTFTRTDHQGGIQYTFDATNSEWLGPLMEFTWGETDTTTNNQYLRHTGRGTPSTSRGYFMPWDLRIVAGSAKWNNGVTSGTIRLRRDNANISAIAHPGGTVDEVSDDSFMDAFSADGAMQVYIDNFNTDISTPTVVFWARRVAT